MQTIVNELRAHWALERCENVLKLLKIYEDSYYFELVLEY
jgi:hypothetical protein